MLRPSPAAGALAAALALGTPLAAQDGPWALTNARIETVTRGTIARGTIVLRHGLIVAVGPDVAIPPDARTLDLQGRTVTPAFLDLMSSAGLPSAPTGGGGGPGGGPPGAGPGALAPERSVADQVRLSASDAAALRAAGVGAVLVAPARGLFRGRSALVPARDSAAGADLIRADVAQHVGYQGVGGGEYPGSLLGVIATQRQMFHDAKRYGLLMDRWRVSPRGMARPERDPRLEALVPAARGAQPVWIEARNENEIRRASRLARELGLALTVAGAVEGWRARDALRGHGVVVALDFPAPTQVTGWRFRTGLARTPGDSAAAADAARRLIEGNAAALHAAGIRFALASGGRPADLLPNVRKAIAAGLPAATALEALTIRAAELAGADATLGSLEPGKIANLAVWTGPPLGDTSRVAELFIDGHRYELAEPRRAGDAERSAGTAPAPVAGTWTITTSSPQGTMESTLTLAQDGPALTGTLASDLFGSAPIAGGRLSGRSLAWSVTLSMGGQSITISYAGEVNGTRMTGTVTAGDFGSFPFTGERRP